jgi:hypothetical protein
MGSLLWGRNALVAFLCLVDMITLSHIKSLIPMGASCPMDFEAQLSILHEVRDLKASRGLRAAKCH